LTGDAVDFHGWACTPPPWNLRVPIAGAGRTRDPR
jgi:hypothetical protein